MFRAPLCAMSIREESGCLQLARPAYGVCSSQSGAGCCLSAALSTGVQADDIAMRGKDRGVVASDGSWAGGGSVVVRRAWCGSQVS